MVARWLAQVLLLIVAVPGPGLTRAAPETFRCAGSPPSPHLFGAARPTRAAAEPVRGLFRAVTLFATFPDVPLAEPPAWSGELFDESRPGSVSHFWKTMSHGLLRVEGEVAPQVFVSSLPSDAYVVEEAVRLGGFARFAQEILTAADAVVDFSRFDEDEDGMVDAVFIVLPWMPQNFLKGPATGMAWLGFYDPYVTNDMQNGVRVRIDPRDGTLQRGAHFAEAAGVVSHEFGHVLGLPDLYHTEFLTFIAGAPRDDSAGIGAWGLMGWGASGWHGDDGPNSLCAWSRMRLGWAQVETPARSREGIRLEDVSLRGQMYRLPLSNGDYFLLENRQRTHSYYERHAPASGLLVWRVPARPREQPVILEAADGRWLDAGYPLGQAPDPKLGETNLEFWAHDQAYSLAHAGNLGDSTDTFGGRRSTCFGPDTNPSSRTDGVATGAAVDSIAADADGVVTAMVRAPAPLRLGRVEVIDGNGDGTLTEEETAQIFVDVSSDFSYAPLSVRLYLTGLPPWLEATHEPATLGRRDGRYELQGPPLTVRGKPGLSGPATAVASLYAEMHTPVAGTTNWVWDGCVTLSATPLLWVARLAGVEELAGNGDGQVQPGEVVRLVIEVNALLAGSKVSVTPADKRLKAFTSPVTELVPSHDRLRVYPSPEVVVSGIWAGGDSLALAVSAVSRDEVVRDTVYLPVTVGVDRTAPIIVDEVRTCQTMEGLDLVLGLDSAVDGSAVERGVVTVLAPGTERPVVTVPLALDGDLLRGTWRGGQAGVYGAYTEVVDSQGNTGRSVVYDLVVTAPYEPGGRPGRSATVALPAAIGDLAYSATGETLAVAAGRRILLYDPLRLVLLKMSADLPDEVRRLAPALEDPGLVACLGDGSVVEWDPSGVGPPEQIGIDCPGICDMEYGPGGGVLALGSVDGRVFLMRGASGSAATVCESKNGGAVRDLAFSANGSRLAVAQGSAIHVWDVESGALRSVLGEGDSPVEAVGFGSAGLLVAQRDGRLTLWDMRSERSRRSTDHGDWPCRLVLHPRSGAVAVSAWDGCLRFYHPASLTPVAADVTGLGGPAAIAYSPDGLQLAAGLATGQLLLWNQGGVVAAEEGGRLRVELPYPNPSAAGFSIPFVLYRDGIVRIEIHDMAGQRIRDVMLGPLVAGKYLEEWDGRTTSGFEVASGVYVCTVRTSGASVSRELVVVR